MPAPLMPILRSEQQAKTRTAVLDGLQATLTQRRHTVQRMGDNITRIDGRFVNLWIMYQQEKRKKGKVDTPEALVVRIGYKDNVRNVATADPEKVASIADGVEAWLKDTPPDLAYDPPPD